MTENTESVCVIRKNNHFKGQITLTRPYMCFCLFVLFFNLFILPQGAFFFDLIGVNLVDWKYSLEKVESKLCFAIQPLR